MKWELTPPRTEKDNVLRLPSTQGWKGPRGLLPLPALRFGSLLHPFHILIAIFVLQIAVDHFHVFVQLRKHILHSSKTPALLRAPRGKAGTATRARLAQAPAGEESCSA